MIRFSFWFCAFLLCMSGLAAEQEIVGDLGSPGQLLLQGAKSFKADTLRRALTHDIDFQVAAHPFAPLKDYLKTVETRLTQGYGHVGFAEPRVVAKAGESNITVTIDEGPRFKAGKVVVTGARVVSPAHIVRWLTDTNAGVSNQVCGVWRPGAYPSFTQLGAATLHAAVTNAYLDAGFPRPQFKLESDLDHDASIAILKVDITNEGPRPKLGSIEIQGAARNRREDILKLLQLTKKTKLDMNLPARVEQRLRDSGRFVKASAVLGSSDANEVTPLLISVQELTEAPPLGRPFSNQEKALLRFREWLLANFGTTADGILSLRGDDDPALPGMKLEMIFSQAGFLISVRQAQRTDQFDHTLVIRPDGYTFYSGPLKCKLAGTMTRGVIKPYASLQPSAEPGERFSLSLGAGIDSEGTGAPLQFKLDLAPAAFVALGHQPEVKSRLREGALTLEFQAMRLRIDARSGRLLDATPLDINAPDTFHFAVRENAFRETLSALEARTAQWPNKLDSERPLSSALAVLLEDALRSPLLTNLVKESSGLHELPSLLLAAQRLSLPYVLEPVNRLFTDFQVDTNETFSIPMDNLSKAGLAAFLGGMGVGRADAVFPKASWPWTLLREACFVAAERGKYTEMELERLVKSADTGPIGCLIAARLLTKVNSAAARSFAIAGMTRTTGDDFLRDVEALASGGTIVAQCFTRALDQVGQLTDPDLDALAKVLPQVHADLLREACALLKKRDNESSIERIRPALEAYWTSFLKEQIRAQLRNVIAPRTQEAREAALRH